MKQNNIDNLSNEPFVLVNWIYEHFNQNVPQITTHPTLQEYNLPDNIHDIIEKEDKKIEKIINSIYAFIYIIGFILSVVYLLNNKNDNYDISEAILTVGFTYGWIALLILPIFSSPIFFLVQLILKKNKKTAPLRERYSQYQDAIYAYIYWEKTTKLNFWMSLDGHQFEDAVAAVYRTNGYIAQVSKQGGDGGVDIILEKDGKTIAVQCKAHKKEIGPSVARDLYGTISHLGIEEGIIVSRSGFTAGVYEFVQNKHIELVTLNDLMNMQTFIKSEKAVQHPQPQKPQPQKPQNQKPQAQKPQAQKPQAQKLQAQKNSNNKLNSNIKNEKVSPEIKTKKEEKKKYSSPQNNSVQLTFEDMTSFFDDDKKTKEKNAPKSNTKAQPTTSTQKTDLPQIDIGTKVSHKSWGEGSIISKGTSTFVVDFNGNEIKYTYPISFQNGTLILK